MPAFMAGPGASRWVSGDRSRKWLHAWRDSFQAILVGSGTVLRDDPSLRGAKSWSRHARKATRRLDALALPRVDFVKMDIEGSELAALRGGERTIRRDKPKLHRTHAWRDWPTAEAARGQR